MSYHYSDPTREKDPHALPDIKVFYADGDQVCIEDEVGWYYYWPCFPGCLPDGDPIGPFKTEAEAMEDAQSTD